MRYLIFASKIPIHFRCAGEVTIGSRRVNPLSALLGMHRRAAEKRHPRSRHRSRASRAVLCAPKRTVRLYQHYIQSLVQLNYTSFQLRCERSRSYKRAHGARNGAHTARAHARVRNAQSIGLALALTSLVASAREQGGPTLKTSTSSAFFF